VTEGRRVAILACVSQKRASRVRKRPRRSEVTWATLQHHFQWAYESGKKKGVVCKACNSQAASLPLGYMCPNCGVKCIACSECEPLKILRRPCELQAHKAKYHNDINEIVVTVRNDPQEYEQQDDSYHDGGMEDVQYSLEEEEDESSSEEESEASQESNGVEESESSDEEEPSGEEATPLQKISRERLVSLIEEIEQDSDEEEEITEKDIENEVPKWAKTPKVTESTPEYSRWRIPESRKKSVLNPKSSLRNLNELLSSQQLPVEFEDLGPYPSQSFLDMHLWWEAAGLPVRALNSLLQWIFKHTKLTKKDVPQSYSTMKTIRKKLNLQEPTEYKLKSGSSFLYYSLKEHLIRIFGNKNHCEHTTFDCPTGNVPMKEFVDTPMWKEACKRATVDGLPIGIVLYYDKFGVFRSRTGSVGGLYFSLVNFDAKWRANDENIFCLGLVPHDGLFLQVASLVVKELNSLQNGVDVYHAGLQRSIKISPTLEIFLADMPQRNQACCQKSHNANRPCHMCLIAAADLSSDKVEALRTKLSSMASYNAMRSDERKKKQLLAYTCLHFMKNPFWAVPNNFDIHQHTPPEIFHLEYVGLVKKHFKLIWNHSLESGNLTKKEIRKAMAERVANFSSQGIVKEMTDMKLMSWADWTGDDWEAFLQISIWVLDGLLIPEHYACWVLHVSYLMIMLRPTLCSEDIDKAEDLAKQFRRAFAENYGDKAKFPNNHQLTHLFDCSRRFGPPTLWWVQTYEMKHKSFKRSADKSNKKDLHIFCAAKEAVFQALLFGFQSRLHSFHTLKETLYSDLEEGVPKKKKLKTTYSTEKYDCNEQFIKDLNFSYRNNSVPPPPTLDNLTVKVVKKMPSLLNSYIQAGDLVMISNSQLLRVIKALEMSDKTNWLEIEEMQVRQVLRDNGVYYEYLDKTTVRICSRFVPVEKVLRKVALVTRNGKKYLNHTVLGFRWE